MIVHILTECIYCTDGCYECMPESPADTARREARMSGMDEWYEQNS